MEKKWIYMALVLVVIAGGVSLLERRDVSSKNDAEKLSLSVDEFMQANQIKLKGHLPEKELTLKKVSEHWVLSEDNFPADGSKIAQFFDQLTKMKVLDEIGEGESLEKEAGFDQGSEVWFQEGDKTLKHLVFGKNADRGGQFLKSEAGKILLLAQAVSLNADASYWELKDFLKVDAEQIRSLEVTTKGAARQYVYNEEKKALVRASEKDGENDLDGANIAKTLARLTFSQRVDAGNEEAKTAIETANHVLKVIMKDASQFEIVIGEIGDETKKHYAAVRSLELKEGSDGNEFLRSMSSQYPQWIFEINPSVMKRLLPPGV